MHRYPRISVLFVSLFFAASAWCDNRVIGTIEAQLDGQPVTWHVLESDAIEGAAGKSALWMQLDEGTRIATIGGFESRDVSFSRDPASGMVHVAGEGSQISLALQFPQGAERVDYVKPGNGPHDAQVVIQPRAGDYSALHMLQSGKLTLDTLVAKQQGDSRFEGTFEGELVNPEGEEVGTLSNGRFSVDQAAFFDPAESR